MRKGLVFGAALAATCVSAMTVSAAAETSTPTPTPSASKRTPVRAAGSPVSSGAGATSVSAQQVLVTPPKPHEATYVYRKGGKQKLDAYWHTPKKGAQPAILLLHGGYWMEGSRTDWKYIARRLAARGYAVFAADYRLSTAARWPAQRGDVDGALAYIKKNAKRWKANPKRVVVVGSSAGGQLATMMGTYGSGAQRVRGVVALSPVNSPYLAYQDGGKATAGKRQKKLRTAVVKLVGCTPGGALCWQRLDDAKSVSFVSKGDAPMLLMHSAKDFVPATHSTQLIDGLRGFGVKAGLKVQKGTAHGAALLSDTPTYKAFLAWIDSVAKK